MINKVRFGYTVEEVSAALKRAVTPDAKDDDPAQQVHVKDIQWNFPITGPAGLFGWRIKLKKLIRHLTAWQWIPVVDELNAQRRATGRILSSLSTSITSLESEVAELRSGLSFIENEVSSVKKGVLSAVEDISELKEALKDISNKISQEISKIRDETYNKIEEIASHLHAAEQKLEDICAQLDGNENNLGKISGKIEDLASVVQNVESSVWSVEKRCDLVETELEKVGSSILNIDREKLPYRVARLERKEGGARDDVPLPSSDADVRGGIDYPLFSEMFRGSVEEVEKLQTEYVELFKECGGPVMDAGCGRGEFLTLLSRAGVDAFGVEKFSEFADECKAAGCKVVCAEIIEHMKTLEPRSLGGVFAAHVIEHNSPAWLVEFIRQCSRCIRPGGVLVMETANPLTIAGWHGYLIDFTHIRPIHPQGLAYVVKRENFREVKIDFKNPVPEEYRLLTPRTEGRSVPDEIKKDLKTIDDLMFGCQDYALIAVKGDE